MYVRCVHNQSSDTNKRRNKPRYAADKVQRRLVAGGEVLVSAASPANLQTSNPAKILILLCLTCCLVRQVPGVQPLGSGLMARLRC